MNLLERARRIEDTAVRLRKFIELKAPEFAIEQARYSLLKKLISFPALPEEIESRERIDNEIVSVEQKFLFENGYYEDIEDDLGKE